MIFILFSFACKMRVCVCQKTHPKTPPETWDWLHSLRSIRASRAKLMDVWITCSLWNRVCITMGYNEVSIWGYIWVWRDFGRDIYIWYLLVQKLSSLLIAGVIPCYNTLTNCGEPPSREQTGMEVAAEGANLANGSLPISETAYAVEQLTSRWIW